MKPNNIQGGAFQSFYVNRQKYEENLKQSASIKKEKNKKIILAASILGAVVPVVALNIANGRGDTFIKTIKNAAATKKDKIKAGFNLFEIDSYKGILASTAGGILSGTFSGVALDKNKHNQKEKYKEGVFEFLNNMIPTTLVAGGELISQKTSLFNSAPKKALMIAGSVVTGMFIANKTANKINEKAFNKDEKFEKRNFKPTDCIVHTDDLLSALVLAKVPFAKYIQADKILPLLYARSGYEAGMAENKTLKTTM